MRWLTGLLIHLTMICLFNLYLALDPTTSLSFAQSRGSHSSGPSSSEGAPSEEMQERWAGFDAAVLEALAKEYGREPKEGLISLEGDLELFMFSLLAGVSGFMAGYYFRKLFVEGTHAFSHREKNQPSP